MTKQRHAVGKYVIARAPAEYPAVADTFTVFYEARENISHHESFAEARAALSRAVDSLGTRAQLAGPPTCSNHLRPVVHISQKLREYIVVGHNPDGPPSIKFHPQIADEAANRIDELESALRAILDKEVSGYQGAAAIARRVLKTK